MRRTFGTILKAALVCASGSAFAQSGDLSTVTMRVLDDVSEIDAVVLELDANRGAGDEETEGADRAAEQAPSAGADEDRLEERHDTGDLHDPDEDERSEGKLEDNDVERPAAPPPAP